MRVSVLLRLFLFIFVFVNIHFAQIIHQLTVDRFTHYKITDWISYAPALFITSIDIDDNYIYFGTRSGGILRYQKYDNHWDFPYTTSSGLRSNTILQIRYNSLDGFLYAETPKGVDVYKPAERFWRPANQNQIPSNGNNSNSNFNMYQETGDAPYRFPPLYRPTNSELPDFFTKVSLIYHLGGIIYDQYNRSFQFTDRIVDTWQRLWVGTNGFGPMKADLDYTFLEAIPQCLPDISPRDIYIDDDSFWIGGLRTSESVGGITHWERKANSWEYFEAPFISQIYKDDVSAITGNNRYILFGTPLGVTVLDKKKQKWKTFDVHDGLNGYNVFDIIIQGDSAYIAAEYGLNWLNLKSMKIHESRETTLDNVRINQLASDGRLIWAATRFGLYSIDPVSDDINFHASRAAIPDYNLTALEIIDDQIWMANWSGIIYWERKSDQWHSFPGLNFNGKIRDIAHTKKNIWFASDKGLLRYNSQKDYWRLYTVQDGLISNNTFRIDRENRNLWISTDKGITAFRWRRKGRLD